MVTKTKDVQFPVTFEAWGSFGSPKVVLNGVPAYGENRNGMYPKVGETWLVRVRYRTSQAIFLRPIKKLSDNRPATTERE